jgi:hypothetical protein
MDIAKMIGQKLYKVVISLNIAVNAFYLVFCISSGEASYVLVIILNSFFLDNL